MKMSEKVIDMAASMNLDEESIGRLGGNEGIKSRVKSYLEERYGNRSWTCVGVSILALGRKPLSDKNHL